MKSYRLSPAAIQDLEAIEAHIASERPSAVEGMLDAIESACQLVADYPGVGRAREEIDESVMSFPIGSYVIFYYLGDDPFGIARILHGSRDLPTAFHDTYESLATVPWRRFLPETGRAVLESFGSNSLPDLAAPVPRARLSACTVPKEGIVV